MSLDSIPRSAYSEDHEAFRQTVRRFMQEQIAPHGAEWAEAGIVPAVLVAIVTVVFSLGCFSLAPAAFAG